MQLRKTRYQINPKTLAMERVEMGFKYWLRRSGWYLIGGFCIGIVFFLVFFYFFPSPRESQLQQQNRNLEAQLQVLNSQVDQMQIVMKDFEQRDENLYRVLFGAEPIPLSVRTGANRRIAYYDSIARMTNSQLASDLTMKVDLLAKETYIQAKSYDELLELAKTQEVRMENLPSSLCSTKTSSVPPRATACVSTPSITSAVSMPEWTSLRRWAPMSLLPVMQRWFSPAGSKAMGTPWNLTMALVTPRYMPICIRC